MSVSPLPRTPVVAPSPPPRFVTGSIARHILVMTGTGAVGLMAIFVSDFATLFFLGLLGDLQLLAAIGYAGAIMFFMFSAGLGMAIAVASLVSPALGAGDFARARRLSTHAAVFTAGGMTLMVAALWPMLPMLLAWFGANGRSLALASDYLRIVLPSLPALALAMASSAVLRSAGDPRRSMYVTLTGAIVASILDATLIYGLSLGVHGAAIAAFVSHVSMLAVGLWAVANVHGLLARPEWRLFEYDAVLIARFAIPAVLANVATPAGSAYVTVAMSQFSDSAVAGWAVIGRIIPIAFGAIFALSGTIGPIIGQNVGARQFDRVRSALYGGLAFAASFTVLAWLALSIGASGLVLLFNARGEAAELIVFFCRRLAPLFVFFGTLFVCNAACNTLGRPHYATALNWGRATLGTIPFVALGAHWGAKGVLVGHMVGGIAFGIVAILVVYRLIVHLERDLH